MKQRLLESFSIECRKTKTKANYNNQSSKNITRSPWELEVKTSKPPKARENASDQVAIGFSLNLIG